MRRKGSTRRRFSKVRFKRQVLITLGMVTVVLVCVRSCAVKAEKTESSEPFIPAAVETTPEPTATLVPMARYPVPLDDDLQLFITQLCEDHHIDPAIVFAMIDRESDYTADLVGDEGEAFGLMQIQPRWHYERMDKLGCHDLTDPYQNVTVGIDYLAECLDYGNGLEWALMAYNGGQNYAYQMQSSGIVSSYAQEVITNSEILTEGVQTVMYRTDDPIADHARWSADQEREAARYPVCVYCGYPILEDKLFDFNGDTYHIECAEEEFQKDTEDYME